MSPHKRWTLILLAAAFSLLDVARGEPAGRTGVLRLTLDESVPLSARGLPRGLRDFELELTWRDGKLSRDVWAYLFATPGLEHRGRLLDVEQTDAKLKAKIELTVLPYPPLYTGGTGVIELDLDRDVHDYRGGYAARWSGLDEREAQALWDAMGAPGKALWLGGLRDGATASVLNVPRGGGPLGGPEVPPVAAHGRFVRLGDARDAAALPKHPRLLTDPQRWKALAERAKGHAAGELLAQLDRTLYPRDDAPAAGSPATRAAGHALRYALLGGAGDRDRCAASAAAALAGWKPNTASGDADPTLERARHVAGLALAYDLAAEAWDEQLRERVRNHLAERAWFFAAQTPPKDIRNIPFGKGAVFGKPVGPFDLRVATVRAAQGLAALAILDAPVPDGHPVDAARLRLALDVAARSVRRFLRTGLGRSGAGLGQYGLDAAIGLVFPFVRAYRSATGADLATGTGTPHVLGLSLTAAGQNFPGAPTSPVGDWLPAALVAAPDALRPAAKWYWRKHDYRPSDPWSGALAAAHFPYDAETVDPSSRREPAVAAHDRDAGVVAFRSGWTPGRSFAAQFNYAAATSRAAGRRGHFALRGLGRQWIVEPAKPGRFDWPAPRRQNTQQVYEGRWTSHRPATPTGPGRLGVAQAARSGSGSASMVASGYEEIDPPEGREKAEVEKSLVWRTLGVDYSGRSGAEALLVTVGGAVGLKDRRRVWEANLGDVPADRVKIEGVSFTVRPEGTNATLRGTVVYPPTAHLAYRPPQEDAGGRIQIGMVPPGVSNAEMLEESLEQKLKEVAETIRRRRPPRAQDEDEEDETAVRHDSPEEIAAAFDDIEIDVKFRVRRANERLRKRMQAEGKVLFNKIYRHVSSIKMGGGDRGPKAKNSCVVVLTVQTGEAPQVKVLPMDHPALLKVGPQIVHYREYLIRFGE